MAVSKSKGEIANICTFFYFLLFFFYFAAGILFNIPSIQPNAFSKLESVHTTFS